MPKYYISSSIKPNMQKVYYFDNNSTTLIYDQNVKDEIINWLSCGNPSNTLHSLGANAKNKIEECRHEIAQNMKVHPNEIYFTSGATESNNLILQGLVRFYKEKYKTSAKKLGIICSSYEHPSILNIMKNYELDSNLKIIFVNPSKTGIIEPEQINNKIENSKYHIICVTIMYANNETGAINNIPKIGSICKKHNIHFHCDSTQVIGKRRILPEKENIDSMCISGHKFHGPKGSGLLYLAKDKSNCMKLCFGGQQEHGLRPGTESISNIAGLTKALIKVHKNRSEKNDKMLKLKNCIINKLNANTSIKLLSPQKHCLPNTILIMFNAIKTCNKEFVKELDKRKICISVGSACQTKKKASHVLDVLGIYDKKEQLKVVRISLSDYTTKEECDYLVKNILEVLQEKY
ncbi:MAG: hypothetical protein CMF62_00885 [Magnetococcales bacterium]|nr:hypothetical protein [Magnetococcales bacterium]|tara:strand:+ start:7033 stop:8247 length:1215 start_codon:yes stop_codon:yes gene_type:complete